MSTYQKRIAVLPAEKAAPFAMIVGKVVVAKGGTEAAATALGVSRTVVRKVVDENYITDKQARVVLAAYKQIKHTL